LFSQNLVTQTEARNRIGLDPLTPAQEDDLFVNKVGSNSQTAGSQRLSQSLANPTNQNTDSKSINKQIVKQCFDAFQNALSNEGIEVTADHVASFKQTFKTYHAKNFSKICSGNILDVKIQVAKDYFESLAQFIIDQNEA
jgi:hypothetical protein